MTRCCQISKKTARQNNSNFVTKKKHEKGIKTSAQLWQLWKNVRPIVDKVDYAALHN